MNALEKKKMKTLLALFPQQGWDVKFETPCIRHECMTTEEQLPQCLLLSIFRMVVNKIRLYVFNKSLVITVIMLA